MELNSIDADAASKFDKYFLAIWAENLTAVDQRCPPATLSSQPQVSFNSVIEEQKYTLEF